MKLLGRGWQYTVYDMGNDRVLKKCNTRFVAYLIMIRDCFPYVKNPIWKFPQYYRECRETALNSIQKIKRIKVEPWMLGNPTVVAEDAYEQDKVTPLSCYFNKIQNASEGKKIIDMFVDFAKTLFTYSVIDKNFDIGNNFALNKDGKMILIDLGELYTTKEEIDSQIKNRIWAAPYVLSGLPTSLHSYFIEKMDATFGINA